MNTLSLRTGQLVFIQWISLALLAIVCPSQQVNAQTHSKWDAFSRPFQARTEASTNPQARQFRQPGQLKVIDRATARGISKPHLGNYPADSSSQANAPEHSHNSNSRSLRPEGQAAVIHASYQPANQHIEQRTYQSPSPNLHPYDVPPGFGSPRFQNQDRPAYSTSNGSLSSRDQLAPKQDWELLDDSQGQPPLEHPDNYTNNARHKFDSGRPEATDPGTASQLDDSSSDFEDPADFQDRQYESGLNYFPSPSDSGRGYLQGGANFHGARLQIPSVTATERAIELDQENEQLRTNLKRTRAQVAELTKNLESSKLSNQRKDDERKILADRTFQLRNQIEKLAQERDTAMRQRFEAEQRFNEQLKDVETMLDGVLVTELSDKSSGGEK